MLKNTLLASLLITGAWAENKVAETKAAEPVVEQVPAVQPRNEAPANHDPARKHHWYSSLGKAFSGGGGQWDWDHADPNANVMGYSTTSIRQEVGQTKR